MMESYEKLYAYLPFFEQRAKLREQGAECGPVIIQSEGLHTEYTDEMNRFIAEIEDADFVDFQYIDTLEKYGITDTDKMLAALPKADPPLLRAAFTKMVRAERFSSGAWAEFEKNGAFLTALKRLGELFGYAPPAKK